jgi:hypothetical protein
VFDFSDSARERLQEYSPGGTNNGWRGLLVTGRPSVAFCSRAATRSVKVRRDVVAEERQLRQLAAFRPDMDWSDERLLERPRV